MHLQRYIHLTKVRLPPGIDSRQSLIRTQPLPLAPSPPAIAHTMYHATVESTALLSQKLKLVHVSLQRSCRSPLFLIIPYSVLNGLVPALCDGWHLCAPPADPCNVTFLNSL